MRGAQGRANGHLRGDHRVLPGEAGQVQSAQDSGVQDRATQIAHRQGAASGAGGGREGKGRIREESGRLMSLRYPWMLFAAGLADSLRYVDARQTWWYYPAG